jgi:hypothetical protein
LGSDKNLSCVIGPWGVTIDRAVDKFVEKTKKIKEAIKDEIN